jgi:hypothetical protein
VVDDKGVGRYERGDVGEVGSSTTRHDKWYTAISNALNEEDSEEKGQRPSDMERNRWFLPDSKVRQTIVKVRVVDNVESLMRTLSQLDGNPTYTPKYTETNINVGNFTGPAEEATEMFKLNP